MDRGLDLLMFNQNSITDSLIDADDSESKPERSKAVKVISIIAALTVTAGLLIGFLIWRNYHAQKVISAEQAHSKQETPALPAKVQIYMDEVVRKGPQALVGGTVQNISNETLSNIVIEFELTHRKDGSREQRSLSVEPADLAPDQKGRYSLTLTGDYRSLKLLHVRTGTRAEEIGFKSSPGVPRPYEPAPETTRTVIITRPNPPKKEEEFINTPDNPAKIP